MNKYIKSLAVGLFAGGCLTSCDIDLEPIDSFSAYNFWSSQTEFEGFITAQSNMFRSNYPGNILFYAGELRAGTLELTTIDGSSVDSPNYIQNIYSQSQCQFSNFGNWYGFIANWNELIYRCENTDVLTEEVKNGLLGMAYGYRAYAYFQMYRMYGGVVLRVDPDVILGNYDATGLYKGRSTAEETLNQIKNDVKASLDYFGKTSYVYKSSTKDYYWTKAASEMLAGEVYLWSGKVDTGDHKANAADVATAETYFKNVINNYGYQLMPNFYDIWTKPHNSESIFSVCYSSENDGVWYTSPLTNFLWARVTGAAYNSYWSTMSKDGWGHAKEGVANRFGRWYDPETGESSKVDSWDICSFGTCRFTFKNALYYQYDKEDSRFDMWFPVYTITDEEIAAGTEYLDNFDPHDVAHYMQGAFYVKVMPQIVSSSIYYCFANDMPLYRLSLAYMYAAECANYAGNNSEVEHYINAVRQRAYGADWDESKYGYKAGTFAENEIAILREKDKEFVYEGQRWWDLRRLTVVKGGTQKDHLVFRPEGCVGYGLDPVANPWMLDVYGNPIQTDVPVLNGTTQDEHLLLWPIDESTLNSDTELEKQQNPGY